MAEINTNPVISEEVATPGKKKKPSLHLPKIFKNKIFIFVISVIFFAASFFMMFGLDKENIIRKKWNWDWLENFTKFLGDIGINFNVSIFTWFIFFFIWGTFFAVYFAILFTKPLKQKLDDRNIRKTGHPMGKAGCVWFYIIFFLLLVGVLAGICIATVQLWPMESMQWEKFGENVWNIFASTGILLLLIAIIPVSFLILFLLLKLVVLVIGFFVGGVSKAVMQSQGYQESMAASQAAAQDIAASMAEAKRLAKGAVGAAHEAQREGTRAMAPQADILFPALTSIDKKWEDAKKENIVVALEGEEVASEVVTNEARGPLDYEQFKLLALEFQSYLCHQKFYFDVNIIRSFIAGLAAARLILLEGLSGTGKSTLPRVFLEYVGGKAYFFPVQATWRDRSDITGYYSDFTGEFKETELLKHLYEASYIPETVNLMVLDEMNISRVEYYFADFLSIFEYPAEDWVVPLLQVKPDTKLPIFIEKGMVRIPTNTWFVGTVNIDDSTFTITDKVYDRAIVIDFKELNLPFESTYRFDKHPIHLQELEKMFAVCKERPENNLNAQERKKFLNLCAFVADTFDVRFGNRIMNQVDNFLPVFVGLGGSKEEALDIMFARKILRKLDGKFESYIKDGLNKLTRYLNTAYGKHTFPETEELIEKFRKKLS